jgi:hypothetical protein
LPPATASAASTATNCSSGLDRNGAWCPPVCQTNTDAKIGWLPNEPDFPVGQTSSVRTSKRHSALPIGRTARIAYEIEAMRGACCKAAQAVVERKPLDELELEECAMLDEGLARAHRILKATVRQVMIARLGRRSRARE